MDPLLKKLNYKEGMNVRLWNCPSELTAQADLWREGSLENSENEQVDFLLGFVQDEDSVRRIFEEMKVYLKGDEILWFSYPKKSSKRYESSIHRDKGWKILGLQNFEAVRQVAINEDWSALRFRHVNYIKQMTRKFTAREQ
ncbi:hypothetical protein [Algoriphagus namhaensis]